MHVCVCVCVVYVVEARGGCLVSGSVTVHLVS